MSYSISFLPKDFLAGLLYEVFKPYKIKDYNLGKYIDN